MAEAAEDSRPKVPRSRIGHVRSAGGDKTISVLVEDVVPHPRYGKYQRRRVKLAAHDPQNAADVGDLVEVAPCRRVSKRKSWRLVRVVRRAEA